MADVIGDGVAGGAEIGGEDGGGAFLVVRELRVSVDVLVDGEEVLILRESGRGDESKREGERCFERNHAASLARSGFRGERDLLVAEEAGDDGEALDDGSGEVGSYGSGVGDVRMVLKK